MTPESWSGLLALAVPPFMAVLAWILRAVHHTGQRVEARLTSLESSIASLSHWMDRLDAKLNWALKKKK